MTSGPPSDYPQGQGTLAAAASGPLRAHHSTPYAASCPPARTNHAAASGQAHLDKTSRMRGSARWWPKLTTACVPDWPPAGSRLLRLVADGQSEVWQSASVCHSRCGKMRPSAYGAIQFLDPWAGRLCGTAGAGARCPRRSPNLKELSTIDRARRSPPPHRCPTLPSAAASFDRPATAGTPEVRPLCWVTVFLRAPALLQLALRARLRQPVRIASRWRAGFHPRSPHTAAASRRSPCAATTVNGASESRSVWNAPACGRCRGVLPRLQTYPPALSAKPMPRPTYFVAHPTTSTLRWPASIPPEGECMRISGIGLPVEKLRLLSFFPPQPPRWPVAGRQLTLAIKSVACRHDTAIHLPNNPSHSGDVCPSVVRER